MVRAYHKRQGMDGTDRMDSELRILDRIDLPAGLEELDDRVMGALSARRHEAAAMRRMMALAAFVSLGGGIVAGSAISKPAAAASPLSPFVSAGALAPSTLLDVQ